MGFYLISNWQTFSRDGFNTIPQFVILDGLIKLITSYIESEESVDTFFGDLSVCLHLRILSKFQIEANSSDQLDLQS